VLKNRFTVSIMNYKKSVSIHPIHRPGKIHSQAVTDRVRKLNRCTDQLKNKIVVVVVVVVVVNDL
jgi:hypothetical protein